jgi:hypothetical protein
MDARAACVLVVLFLSLGNPTLAGEFYVLLLSSQVHII